MKRIVWDHTERVSSYVAELLNEREFIKPCGALGLEKDGELVAGVVFDCYTGTNLMMHVASDSSKLWMTPSYLYFCFAHPFITLKCNLVTGFVREDNQVAFEFDQKLGFKHTGRLPQACSDGTDLLVLTMVKSDCRYLKDKYRESFLQYLKTIPKPTA